MLRLPHTDLVVSPVCLGTDIAGTSKNEAEFFALLDAFVAGGGNFLDTANVYARWLPHGENCSEQMIGRWLQSRRAPLVIATKGGHYDLQTKRSRVNKTDVSWDIESSLTTLGVEALDLYYLHRDDPQKEIGEILEMMNGFVKKGKIRFFAASNFSTARLKEAADYASSHGIAGFVGVSNRGSLARPNTITNPTPDTMWTCDDAEWQYHTQTKLPFLPYSATAHGYFAKRAAGRETLSGYDNAANDATFARLLALSHETGESIQTLTLTEYVKSAAFPLIPVAGVGSMAQMNDLLAALRLL